MFEKLVVSTAQRRRGRTAKFFVFTSFLYLSVVGVAFALSVWLSTPKLADTAGKGLERIIFPAGGVAAQKQSDGRQPKVAPTKDPRNLQSLERIISDLANPRTPAIENVPPGPERVGELALEAGDGKGLIPGIPGSPSRDAGPGSIITDPPRPPDRQKPQPPPAERPRTIALSSTVLQGKAIDRVVPVYPELARRIRLQGGVSTEVIISPDGRVESVRVVSGHPLLVQAAIDAARRWRFGPTVLNGVPVRVTGVITFVFKLSD